MFDLNISISTIIALGSIVVGFIVQWVSLKSRSETNASKIQSNTEKITHLENTMVEMQLAIAKEYAPKTMIADVESRILDRMTEQNRQLAENIKNLTDEFREVRKILMER